MTGADKIKEKILEDARLQAQNNLERAEKEAADIIKAAREESEKRKKDRMEKVQREAEDRKKRIISVTELEGRKMKLSAKQEVIEAVFKNAMEKLNSLPDSEYRETLSDMIADAVVTGKEQVIISESDHKRLGEGFIEFVNSKLLPLGKQGLLCLAEEHRPIRGGFILKEENIEINHSFVAIMKMQRERLEAAVVDILF